MIIASLHGHSKYSDGQNTPQQIIKEAIKHKISYIALTDHDTVNGIPELYEHSQGTNVIPIAGIEFLTKDGDLIAISPKELKDNLAFLKWCSNLKAKKYSALEIIIQGINKYNCLFIIPHPELIINSLKIDKIRQIYLTLSNKQLQHIAIEINNGATQVLNNNNRLKKINQFLKKHPMNQLNGPDFHHSRWVSYSTSSLPDHKPDYKQFYQLFKSGKLSSDQPPKLNILQFINIIITQINSFFGSRFQTAIKRKRPHIPSNSLLSLISNSS